MQMMMQKAFDSCRDAFTAMKTDPKWTKEGAKRPLTTSPLGLFIEHRTPVWVEKAALTALRAEMPRLAPLPGIKSSIYGLRWVPSSSTITTARFSCLCSSCVQVAPRPQCVYAGMSQEKSMSFRVIASRGPKSVTIKQLKAFLAIRAPQMKKSGSKAELVARVAPLLSWLAGEREAVAGDEQKLTEAVSIKIVEFEAIQQEARDQKEMAILAAGRQMRHAEELVEQAKEQMQKLQQSGGDDAVLALQMTVMQLHLVKAQHLEKSEDGKKEGKADGKAVKRPASSPPPAPAFLSSSSASLAKPSSSAASGPGTSGFAKRPAVTVGAADAAKAAISLLSEHSRLSVYYADEGWLSGFVVKNSPSDSGMILVVWDCDVSGCPANAASRFDCSSSCCTHGDAGADGRERTRLKKSTLVVNYQAGEVRLNDEVNQ